MSPNFSTNLRMQQQQVLAPQLQQSLKILQVPAIELQAMISRQLAANPTLETFDPDRDDDSRDMESFDPDVQDITSVREEREQSLSSENNQMLKNTDAPEKVYEKELENIISEDENWKEYYESEEVTPSYSKHNESVSYKERKTSDDDDYLYRIQSIPSMHSLIDELREQYMSLNFSDEQNEVLEYIIGSLDKHGFLTETPEEIAASLKQDINLVEQSINIFKNFDPTGIGAEDLRECLLIQLERKGDKHSLEYKLIEEYYDELLNNRRDQIAKGLQISIEELDDVIKNIGRLDPNPGRDLSTEAALVIIPDIIVARRENGSYNVETNDNLLPYIRVNPRIRSHIKSKSLPKKELSYLRSEIRNGENFINTIQFRKRTILAVAEAIVEAQIDFLNEGISALKPLAMKEVADKVGVHEATVSRTVNDKYMDTPQGIFEMRYFFSSHVANSNGDDVSTNTVKAKLTEIIKGEDKQNPFSDAKLAEILEKEGYPIARRTVVKYRKSLGILNTRQRKTFV